jgi:hypothetical protein
MNVMIGPRDDDLLDLVNAGAFLAAFHLENETVLRANLRRDVGLDRQIRVRKNIEVVHQLLDELEIFHAELLRQIFHDDRRFDVNDFLRLDLGLNCCGRYVWRGRLN